MVPSQLFPFCLCLLVSHSQICLATEEGSAWFTVLPWAKFLKSVSSSSQKARRCTWCQEWEKSSGLIWWGTLCVPTIERSHSLTGFIRNKAMTLTVTSCILLLIPKSEEVLCKMAFKIPPPLPWCACPESSLGLQIWWIWLQCWDYVIRQALP